MAFLGARLVVYLRSWDLPTGSRIAWVERPSAGACTGCWLTPGAHAWTLLQLNPRAAHAALDRRRCPGDYEGPP